MRIKSKNTGQGAKVGDYDTINHIEVKPDKLKNLSFIDAFKKDISEKHLVSITSYFISQFHVVGIFFA
jgi:hypothetical protein